jgi:hypothetical protein
VHPPCVCEEREEEPQNVGEERRRQAGALHELQAAIDDAAVERLLSGGEVGRGGEGGVRREGRYFVRGLRFSGRNLLGDGNCKTHRISLQYRHALIPAIQAGHCILLQFFVCECK